MSTDVLNYTSFNCDKGWIGIMSSAKGLLRLILPQRSVQAVHQQLGNSVKNATWSPQMFENLTERLRIYFGGYEADFPDELDLSQATIFQRKVWEVTRLIPYGKTKTYGWVAEQIGQPKAMRAAGQALSRNLLPIIIPCHRVTASDGKLGGFNGGVEMKRYLLFLEASASNQ